LDDPGCRAFFEGAAKGGAPSPSSWRREKLAITLLAPLAFAVKHRDADHPVRWSPLFAHNAWIWLIIGSPSRACMILPSDHSPAWLILVLYDPPAGIQGNLC
jgi:hypothetical protein